MRPVILLACLTIGCPAQAVDQRPRLLFETDIGGDPDDQASLVRFLMYSHAFDIEGILTVRTKELSSPRYGATTGFELINAYYDAYEQVHPQLLVHHPDFPSAAALRSKTVDAWNRATGDRDAPDAMDLIIRAVDEDDPRPLWLANWGTGSAIARALDQVQAERSPAEYLAFIARVRFSRDDRLGMEHLQHASLYVNQRDPDAFYHSWSGLTANAGGFDVDHDIRRDHGILGSMYSGTKEGDTQGGFLYLLPLGMNDPERPDWGTWAGRFGPRDQELIGPAFWWANAEDHWQGSTNRGNTVGRWASAIQNDFRGRLDWCVASTYAQGNHPPVAVVQGDAQPRIRFLTVSADSTVSLSAAGSSDPDGDGLSYAWIHYREASTYDGAVGIAGHDQRDCTIAIPGDAGDRTIHLILAVADDDSHRAGLLGTVPWYTEPTPMTRYRRIVLQVDGASDNEAPRITAGPSVDAEPVTGTSAVLSVAASDDGGDAQLTYAWTVEAGAPGAVFSSQAPTTTVTFAHAGAYTVAVTVSDSGGASTTGSVDFTVAQQASALLLTP